MQYDVDFPHDESEISGHAIYMLIRTGRVRFLDQANVQQRLESVPAVAFSEVMRRAEPR